MLSNNKNNFHQKIALGYTAFVFMAIFFVALIVVVNPAYAQSAQSGSGLEGTAGLEDVAPVLQLPETDIRVFILRLINVILGFLGIILVGIISYGGWVYMTSEGDAEKVNKAKAILKNAVIGLIIILSALGIVNFIFRALLGVKGGLGLPTRPPFDEVGVTALGNGIIESHYPERNQREVPINTSIIITFKEEIDPGTVCDVTQGDDKTKCDGNASSFGDTLISNNIKIYLDKNNDDTDENKQRTDVLVKSDDNKTFVFKPQGPLGQNDNQLRWFAVKLIQGKGRAPGDGGLWKLSGDKVDFGLYTFYKWRFETNGDLDLTPPQVENIYPPADNEQDEQGIIQGAKKASGVITVKGIPKVAKRGSGSVVDEPDYYTDFTIEGEYQFCQGEGDAVFAVSYSGETGGTSLVLEGETSIKTFTGEALIIDNQASIGCGLAVAFNNDVPVDGTKIKINVEQAVAADTLTIGSTKLIFGRDIIFNTVNKREIAEIIADKINETHGQVTATSDNKNIIITAKTSGKAGNNIALKTLSTALTFSADSIEFKDGTLAGGSDQEETTEIKGLPDPARNAVIQVNFNEAVNPLQVNGEAGDVKEYISVRCVSGCTDGEPGTFDCDGAGPRTAICLEGKFMISNIYKTVEFTTDRKCGNNSCGDEVYCLPPLSNIKVFLKAASLETPGESSQSADMDGIMDAAFNSLDGDKSGGIAEGPQRQSGKPEFNENDLIGICTGIDDKEKVCTDETVDKICKSPKRCRDVNGDEVRSLETIQTEQGDNYTWSFYISNKIDLESPIIESATQEGENLVVKGGQKLGADQEAPLNIQFNKLMLSSSLKPDGNYPDDYYHSDDPKIKVQREYLVFIKYTAVPLGYWCGKRDEDVPLDTDGDGTIDVPKDGYVDKTTAIISHTKLGKSDPYGFVVGSGVKDIYQNCYNPAGDNYEDSVSECDPAVMPAGQSCCKGEPLIDADGNPILDGFCYEF